MKPLQAARKPAGISNWSKESIGVSGVVPWTEIECFFRNSSMTTGEGSTRDEDATGSDTSVFFAFFSFLDFLFALTESSGSGESADGLGCFLSFLEGLTVSGAFEWMSKNAEYALTERPHLQLSLPECPQIRSCASSCLSCLSCPRHLLAPLAYVSSSSRLWS